MNKTDLLDDLDAAFESGSRSDSMLGFGAQVSDDGHPLDEPPGRPLDPFIIPDMGQYFHLLGGTLPPDQPYEELFDNSREGVGERVRLDPQLQGRIAFEFDWVDLQKQIRRGVQPDDLTHDLMVTDNGIGMSGEEMRDRLRFVLNPDHSYKEIRRGANFNHGLRLVMYQKEALLIGWQDGVGSMARFGFYPNGGWGLLPWGDEDDGETIKEPPEEYCIDSTTGLPIQDGFRVIVRTPVDHKVGTLFSFTGEYGKGVLSHLDNFFNRRYWEIPHGLLRCWEPEGTPDNWPVYPRNEKDKAQFRQPVGVKGILTTRSWFQSYETVDIGRAVVHVFIMGEKKDRKFEDATHRTKTTGVLSQGKVFHASTHQSHMYHFGIYSSSARDRLLIFVEPEDAEMNVQRSGLIFMVDGEPVTSPPWERWGAMFRERMPQSVKDLLEDAKVEMSFDASAARKYVEDVLGQAIQDAGLIQRKPVYGQRGSAKKHQHQCVGCLFRLHAVRAPSACPQCGSIGTLQKCIPLRCDTCGKASHLPSVFIGDPCGEGSCTGHWEKRRGAHPHKKTTLEVPEIIFDGEPYNPDQHHLPLKHLAEKPSQLTLHTNHPFFKGIRKELDEHYGDRPGADEAIESTVIRQLAVYWGLNILQIRIEYLTCRWDPGVRDRMLSSESLFASALFPAEKSLLLRRLRQMLGTKFGASTKK